MIASEESKDEKLPKNMAWKRYFEPAIVVKLMSNDPKRFWAFGLWVIIYYLIQISCCIAIVNFYSDADRGLSCGIDNYRKPLDAAAVFD